jgi:MFS family permease
MNKLLVRINKVIMLLTLSDVFTWGSFVVISALSGIYLSNKLGTDTIQFVGIGTGIYFITRAIFQIPVGILTDKLDKDKDEIIILFIGTLLAGLPYLFYPIITKPWQYFLLQFVFGFGISMNVVNWRKMFALNITEGLEGKEYALYDAILSASTAVISVILGVVANIGDEYFDVVMTISGITMMLACVWILLISRVKDRKSKN